MTPEARVEVQAFERYLERKAAYRVALAAWKAGGEQGPPPPRPVDAGVCRQSPSLRHGILTRNMKRSKKRKWYAGLEQTCVHCGSTIRRPHDKSVRWYAVDKSVPALSERALGTEAPK